MESGNSIAYLGGGCFWCIESVFAELPGVKKSVSGIMELADQPQIEVIQVMYDPQVVHFQKLVNVLLKNIDPTQKNAQFTNEGSEYQTAIFYATEEEKVVGERCLDYLRSSGKYSKPIETLLLKVGSFSPAPEEHQNYYKKHPEEFEKYEKEIGRTRYLQTCPLLDEI